ncbi:MULTISPECIES: PH domain-containing protein [unclassified Streptomyces]|uniref:PH domain-containing protein n=1 Tax=Streptomycetaceae TaxID=2062 RepID=UPI002E7A2B55|nr:MULTISPECIES: PH domain-containing protein [unclassified Streptomyces]MED7952231.1 PH domain-containing protein [Streptomyces sp. BE303]MEE1826496.1 PH domain-containing protein [Streptomyces sp. BE20]
MTESDGKPHQGSAGSDGEPVYADRVYRSVPGVISGVLLLAVAAWLIGDAAINGSGKTPWVSLAAVPVFVLPVIAYTLRPAVLANERRLVVRNPLRTIIAPWAAVDALRAGYSVELLADGRKFQVWAVPVSLRQRKRAARAREHGGRQHASRLGMVFGQASSGAAVQGSTDPNRAWSDQVVGVLQETAERNASRPDAAGPVQVRWCWWIIAPTLAGLVALITIIAV